MDLERLLGTATEAGVIGVALQLGLILVVTIVAVLVAQRGVDAAVRTLLDRETKEGTAQELSAIEVRKRRDTLSGLGGGSLRAVIIVIGVLMALRAVNLDIGPAIAGLGILGLAVGLGAQGLVKDIVAGAFILAENHYGRGDIVTIAAVTGTVEDLGLRRTVLRDFDGTVHIVPNGLIGVASNLTRVWARIVVDIPIKDAARVDEAITLIDKAGEAMSADPRWKRKLLSAPKVDRVKSISGAGVTLKVVGSVAAGDRWDAGGDLRARILTVLSAAGVELGG